MADLHADAPASLPQSPQPSTPTIDVHRMPVLLPRPYPHQPIRELDAHAFADLHFAHHTVDVPDSVLFPFLHGLEGGNEQQNAFLYSSSLVDSSGRDRKGHHATHYPPAVEGIQPIPRVPLYRGLVWVACDEDESEADADAARASQDRYDIDLDDDDYDFEYDDDFDRDHEHTSDCHSDVADEERMQVDFGVNSGEETEGREPGGNSDEPRAADNAITPDRSGDSCLSSADAVPPALTDPNEAAHMHPQALRKPIAASAPIAIQTGGINNHSSFFSPPPAHQHHFHHHVNFPTSGAISSHEHSLDHEHDRRLSTSSATSSSSTSTSNSGSAPSTYGFGGSASYSTTASSIGPYEKPSSTMEETNSESNFSPIVSSPATTASTTLTTPENSPTIDAAVDECIPSVAQPKDGDALSSSASVDAATEVASSDAAHPAPTEINGPELDTRRLTIGSSFRPSDILTTDPADGSPMLKPVEVPKGISLRNFGIQLPIYATLSDIVVYSKRGTPAGLRAAFALAEKCKLAIERKANERLGMYKKANLNVKWLRDGSLGELRPKETENPDSSNQAHLVSYNVFVLTDPLPILAQKAPWLLSRIPEPGGTHMVHPAGGSCLAGKLPTEPSAGNTNQGTEKEAGDESEGEQDAKEPVAPMHSDGTANETASAHPSPTGHNILHAVDFAQRERDEMRELTRATPILGDCVYLGNASDVPLQRLRPRLGGVRMVQPGSDETEVTSHSFDSSDNPMRFDVCIECRDCAPLPSTDEIDTATAHLALLDAIWNIHMYKSDNDPRSPRPAPCAAHVVHLAFPASPPSHAYTMWHLTPFLKFLSSLISPRQNLPRTRPMRVLIYSSDGYTESSVLALCILMKELGLDLPEAYLEMQVEKGRSFFVYQSDLGVLKRVESQLQKERASSKIAPSFRSARSDAASPSPDREWGRRSTPRETGTAHPYARSARNSISHPIAAGAGSHDAVNVGEVPSQMVVPSHGFDVRRPRSQTSPNLPPHVDHQTWFNDPRFDGSFPSRVLPFLYLGNLNHAQNAYMLHALGITHVVSVGECALVPPERVATDDQSDGYHLVAGRGPGGQGSLWMEQREGRIKVLDIKGVCDDGMDSLQHQLAPICEWMEKARQDGGKILVHCRVGVSRSATVTIAYVMKHLALPLVDAYLVVRSRRLNVLIQPNMRLLYDLCGWEVELARERSGGDTDKLRSELARMLNWPFLAREVHRLNEKYLI